MTAAFRRAALLVLAVLLPVLVASGAARAAEVIDSYRSEIDISADGAITVTEIITVNAEGREIRRGIFRDFPLYMVDANGRRQKVGFDILSVARDGGEEIGTPKRSPAGSASIWARPKRCSNPAATPLN